LIDLLIYLFVDLFIYLFIYLFKNNGDRRYAQREQSQAVFLGRG